MRPRTISVRGGGPSWAHSAERTPVGDDNGDMEFRDVVDRRRMVRAYESTPVEPAAVDRITRAGTTAPTAGNSRGAAVVVVVDPDRRRAIADAAGERSWVARGFDPWLSTAPVHLVIVASEGAYRRRYDEDDKARSTALDIPWWWVDAGAMLEAMALAAVDDGLAAGFLGAHAIDGLARIVGLPYDAHPVGVLTVGHPAPDRRSRSLARPGPARLHRDTWGG